ncbi:hypothetical protein EJ02DRAFT_452417 [Clathrospora elynae]|uniref:Uncharacterized protein n=1 Tax=Clathrospora elynae TaxID=706981 RepID=A0A6A5SXB7_9PLEO|nr:hypothetical protein EJ02DRAFT_452417 [Clathrospora elynae]
MGKHRSTSSTSGAPSLCDVANSLPPTPLLAQTSSDAHIRHLELVQSQLAQHSIHRVRSDRGYHLLRRSSRHHYLASSRNATGTVAFSSSYDAQRRQNTTLNWRAIHLPEFRSKCSSAVVSSPEDIFRIIVYCTSSTMEMWMSWAMCLVIGGAAYWYYTNQNNGAIARGRSTTGKPTTNSLKDALSWAESETKPKAAPKVAKAKAPRKSVKTAVQEAGNKAAAALSQASTTAGADADSSSVASPMVASNKAPSGRDVSDMLGFQPAIPSVLSIKPADKTTRPTKSQTQKSDVSQETKKQRQNKKKVEEAKAAREEEEKQRQVLQEKQRRTAREARGEPAKNGLQQAKAPTSNAWTEVPSRGAVQPPKSAPSGQLLDTFEAAPAASSAAPPNGTATISATYNNLPSEEEQLRLAMEDSAWTTVPKGGKTKRKTVNEELMEERGDVGVAETQQPVKPARPTQAMKPENAKPSSRFEALADGFTVTGSDDADDWAVM